MYACVRARVCVQRRREGGSKGSDEPPFQTRF